MGFPCAAPRHLFLGKPCEKRVRRCTRAALLRLNVAATQLKTKYRARDTDVRLLMGLQGERAPHIAVGQVNTATGNAGHGGESVSTAVLTRWRFLLFYFLFLVFPVFSQRRRTDEQPRVNVSSCLPRHKAKTHSLKKQRTIIFPFACLPACPEEHRVG